MDVLKLLSEIEDIVEEGTALPFSSKVVIDQFAILDIIKDIRLTLPDDLEKAEFISKDKEKIIEEANETAESIIAQAEATYHELIDREEITQGAKKKSEEIVKCAKENAREIQLGSMEYADSILDRTQNSLNEIISLIDENRKELIVEENCSDSKEE